MEPSGRPIDRLRDAAQREDAQQRPGVVPFCPEEKHDEILADHREDSERRHAEECECRDRLGPEPSQLAMVARNLAEARDRHGMQGAAEDAEHALVDEYGVLVIAEHHRSAAVAESHAVCRAGDEGRHGQAAAIEAEPQHVLHARSERRPSWQPAASQPYGDGFEQVCRDGPQRQRPEVVAGKRHGDGDRCARGISGDVYDRQLAELHRSAQERAVLAIESGHHERQAGNGRDRGQVRLAVELGDERTARHDQDSHAATDANGDPEKRADLALRDVLSLGDGVPGAEIDEQRGKSRQRGDHADDAIILRSEQASQEQHRSDLDQPVDTPCDGSDDRALEKPLAVSGFGPVLAEIDARHANSVLGYALTGEIAEKLMGATRESAVSYLDRHARWSPTRDQAARLRPSEHR